MYTATHKDWALSTTDNSTPESEVMAKELPIEADKLMSISKQLDDLNDIMFNNINEVLMQGEKLDALQAKSKDLSVTSVRFYTDAKSQGACCKLY
jgi:hypothetical protein